MRSKFMCLFRILRNLLGSAGCAERFTFGSCRFFSQEWQVNSFLINGRLTGGFQTGGLPNLDSSVPIFPFRDCPDLSFSSFFIDLLMGLFRGAVFRHGGGALKQPIKEPTETPANQHLGLNGPFSLVNGPFSDLNGAFH